jgi:hypothetical protein
MTAIRAAAIALLLLGCDDGQEIVDAAAMVDGSAGSIGSPCTSDGDCNEGTNPVCFTQTLLDDPDRGPTSGGYCSSSCTSFHDCGSTGSCVSFLGGGSFCVAHCGGPGECRPGYACFAVSGGSCLPSASLTCDPTLPSGLCTTTDGKSGGCLREAHGPGLTGICLELCAPVAGACPPVGATVRQCMVYDDSGSKDVEAAAPDTFKGAVCINNFSSNASGVECIATNSSGKTADFLEACAPGLECNLSGAFNGDNLCHALCVPGSSGGVADAGTADCPAGQACDDVFGLFGANAPVGLCR